VWYGSAEWQETDGSYVYDDQIDIPVRDCRHCDWPMEVSDIQVIKPEGVYMIEVTYACECGGPDGKSIYHEAEAKTGGTAANYIFDLDIRLEAKQNELREEIKWVELQDEEDYEKIKQTEASRFELVKRVKKQWLGFDGKNWEFSGNRLDVDEDGNPILDNEEVERQLWNMGDFSPKIHGYTFRGIEEKLVALKRERINNHEALRRKRDRIEEIQNERENLANVHLGAEGMEMTPDIMDYPGLPVVPDSYGTNSALESGQGVPVWYGSAEGANPSGGATGDQIVSWESGGLSSPSGPPSDIFWAEMGRGSKWSEADAAHALLRRKSKKQRTIDRKRSRRQKYSAEYDPSHHDDNIVCNDCGLPGFSIRQSGGKIPMFFNAHLSSIRGENLYQCIGCAGCFGSPRSKYSSETGWPYHDGEVKKVNTEANLRAIEWRQGRTLFPSEEKELKEHLAKIDAAIVAGDWDKVRKLLQESQHPIELIHKVYSAEEERIRNAGELVDYVDSIMNGKVFVVKPFTLPPYLDELIHQDKAEIMTSQDEMDILFRDGSMASCIYDARNNTLNTFVVAYAGDEEYNSETLDSYNWDKTEYEKKDLEIVKPFGTAMKATMGVAAGTAAILAIMVGLTRIGGNNE